MSNLGQAVLIVGGTIIGSYFGYPQLGFALGALAGSELFPTQLPAGPKLTDNRTTTSNVGDPVPIIFGTATVAGTVIWLAPYVEHSNKQGGKGGPTQTTYSYTQSIAIALCESVVDLDQAIHGISRIWENGTIVYDIRPQQVASTENGHIAESDEQYANRLTASAAYAETFTLYLGTEDQVADATIEAVLGFGNVPAFRGLAYVVYPNRALQTTQGWRHPNFTFECFAEGISNCVDADLVSNDYLGPWDEDSKDPRDPRTSYVYNAVYSGAPINRTFDQAVADWATQGVALNTTICYGHGGGNSGLGAIGPSAYPAWDRNTTDAFKYLFYNIGTPPAFEIDHRDDGLGACVFVITNPFGSGVWWNSIFASTPYGAGPHGIWTFPWPENTGIGNCDTLGVNAIRCQQDFPIEVFRYPAAPASPCFGLPDAPVDGYCIKPGGKLIRKAPWTYDASGLHAYICLQSWHLSGSPIQYVRVPLNPTMRTTDPNNTMAFWTAAYNAAVLAGDLPAGLVYGVDYPMGTNDSNGTPNHAWIITQTTCDAAGDFAKLDEIVSKLCQRAGLPLSAFDVSELADANLTIGGYSISSPSDATNAIQPLRSIGFFDAVESSGVLCFRTRGKEVVATLTAEQIGAFDGGSGGTVPPSVKTDRIDETTLPRTIRLHYKATNRDYLDGQQISPFRLTTKAINDQDISLPFCITDMQALRCAEIIWSDAWAGKNSYTIAVDQSLSEIEVGDCIGIPVDGVIQRARIISEQLSSGILRKLSLVSDNRGSYISFAVAEPSQVPPPVLQLLAGTQAELLDLPALQDADSDPGFYVAAQRTNTGNSWKGCTFYKSIDGGSTYNTLFSELVEATYGTILASIPESEYFTWDDVTEIIVNLSSSAFSLESRTDDAVINGANAAAVGIDGRWEIIQWANALQLSPAQWKISRLLRGRRGTEHNIGRSQASDAFVVISTGDLGRVVLSSSEIGAARKYSVPSIGASFSSGTVYPFVGHAMALTPFSPVDVRAVLLSDGDIKIEWTRRDRLGRTLMSGVDMPISETLLQFQVDIYHGSSPETVARTLTTSVTSALYTAAEQITDFGSGGLVEFRCIVYQMSSVVGRGIGADQIITIGTSP